MRFHGSTLIVAGLFSLACADTPLTPPSTGTAAIGVDPSNIIVVDPQSKTFGISAGNAHSCAVTGALTLRCWGSNSEGQAPQRVGPPESNLYFQVSAGTGDNTCALSLSFAAECFGKNDIGQSPDVRSSEDESFFIQVDAGKDHACALNLNLAIECWGGDAESYAPSIYLPNEAGIMQVSAGDESTCVLRTDGAIECGGVPGMGDVLSIYPRRFTRISVGRHFMCAIHGDATRMSCRGDNGSGQAPLTRTAGGGSRYVDVSAGDYHACALRKDRLIECWGDNSWGQAPTTIGRFIQVSAGSSHTCGLRADLVTECWGLNTSGQTVAPPGLQQVFKFTGFRGQQLTNPNPGALNHVVLFSGGGNTKVKFSLGSNEGLGAVAPGYPKVAQINCTAPEKFETGTSTTGSLSYSATDDWYTYAWQIPGALTKSCQQFILKLTDGTYHRVNFRFTGPPAAIIKTSDGGASAYEGQPAPSVTLRLVDEFGFGIAAREMTFAVTQGGGTVGVPSRKTDPLGFVEVPDWTVGPPGPQTLRATVVAVAGTFTYDIATTSVPAPEFSDATLQGTFIFGEFRFHLETEQSNAPPAGQPLPLPKGFTSQLTTVTFDGIGGLTYSGTRNTDGIASAESGSCPYSVAADGMVTICGDASARWSVNAGGTMLVGAKISDEPAIDIAIKQGGTFNNASLTGPFHFNSFYFDNTTGQPNTPPVGNQLPVPKGLHSEFDVVTFDGIGTATISGINNGDGVGHSFTDSCSYSVASDGKVYLCGDPNSDWRIMIGGNVVVRAATSDLPQLTIGIRKSGTFSNASLSGAYAVSQFYFNGAGQLNTPAPGTELPTPKGANSSFATVTFDGAGNATSVGTENTDGTGAPSTVNFTYSVAADGTITIPLEGEAMSGGVLLGGSVIIFAKTSGAPGISIGIKK